MLCMKRMAYLKTVYEKYQLILVDHSNQCRETKSRFDIIFVYGIRQKARSYSTAHNLGNRALLFSY